MARIRAIKVTMVGPGVALATAMTVTNSRIEARSMKLLAYREIVRVGGRASIFIHFALL